MLRHFQCRLKFNHRVGVITKELLYSFIVEVGQVIEIKFIELKLILVSFTLVNYPLHQDLKLKCSVEWIDVDVHTLLFLKASLLMNQRIGAVKTNEEIIQQILLNILLVAHSVLKTRVFVN